MPDGDDDVIIIRHNNIAVVKSFLAKAAESAEDESVKSAVLEAVSPPPDIAPADTSTD